MKEILKAKQRGHVVAKLGHEGERDHGPRRKHGQPYGRRHRHACDNMARDEHDYVGQTDAHRDMDVGAWRQQLQDADSVLPCVPSRETSPQVRLFLTVCLYGRKNCNI